jgi:hypothetical protein
MRKKDHDRIWDAVRKWMNRVYLFQQVDSIIDDIVRDRVREALAKEYRNGLKRRE